MCKVQMLRALVKQRLTAAAEEICGLFERTIAEYEEELSRSKEENERQQKLLDAVLHPQLQLHRADDQQLLVVKEEVPPEQQEWSSSLDQEDPEPPHIKEEQEELWTSQEGEQLQWLEEADIKFPFSPVSVKSEEDDEEEPQSSQFHQRQTEQMETEADGEDCGGPEPARNSDPDSHLQPDTDDKPGDSSEPDTENSDDWKETREPESGLNCLENDEVAVSDLRCSTGEKPFNSHTGETYLNCSVCDKRFSRKADVKIHMRTHTGEKPCSCPVCKKSFTQNGSLQNHMRTHTGEKPFSCSVCKKSFTQSGHLQKHMRTHTDVQQLLVVEEDVPPEHQEWSSSLDQEDPEPQHIKEEQEELWTSQEGQQLQGLEEADIKFPFTPVHVKNEEDDEEKPQSSQRHQRQTEENREAEHLKTEADGEDCGGPGPARNSDPDTHLQLDTNDKTGDSSEPEADDCGDWKETREPQSGLNSLNNEEVSVGDLRCFIESENLKRHKRTHTGEKTFTCSICQKSFTQSGNLQMHMRLHTGEKPFSCSVCQKSFTQSGDLQRHVMTHTGEKPFSCSVCGKGFIRSGELKRHMRTHTGEKPHSCLFCEKSFSQRGSLQMHMRIHTGEKPFSCLVCEKSFTQNGDLQRHVMTHTGEKPFSCSVCGKGFIRSGDVKMHMRTHRGENPFSCL
ncbi:zinc finger protein 2 homolog [Sebastes umbrosus]|uniref:zinc finger protein 2 homolog n=1 Tax=Sebastes umbrosus TaxID=72105 RepID=UPI00189DDD65|nr:zinc finger protein 2 homolog [Sebastes umbrosus]